MDAQLPVDPRTLDAGEDAQVGGEPRGVWRVRERNAAVRKTTRQKKAEEACMCAARRRDIISHRPHTDLCVRSDSNLKAKKCISDSKWIPD